MPSFHHINPRLVLPPDTSTYSPLCHQFLVFRPGQPVLQGTIDSYKGTSTETATAPQLGSPQTSNIALPEAKRSDPSCVLSPPRTPPDHQDICTKSIVNTPEPRQRARPPCFVCSLHCAAQPREATSLQCRIHQSVCHPDAKTTAEARLPPPH